MSHAQRRQVAVPRRNSTETKEAKDQEAGKETKNEVIEALTELLKEQDPEDLDEIFELVEKMIKECKHLEAAHVPLNK